MTVKSKTPKRPGIVASGLDRRRKRLQAFGEVIAISLVIQALANFAFERCGLDIRLATYEVALIWLFCI